VHSSSILKQSSKIRSEKNSTMKFFLLAFIASIIFPVYLSAKPELEDLKTGSPEQQISAMYYFGYTGNKKAFWYMVNNLGKTINGNEESPLAQRVRQAAAEALGRIRDERAVPFLIERFGREKNDRVKRAILFGLSFYKNPEILPVLKQGLESENSEVLNEALRLAAELGDKNVIPRIKTLSIKENDEIFELSRAFVLLRLEDEQDENSKILIAGLKSKNPLIRFWSANYLSMTARTEAIKEIIKALEIENYIWVSREMERSLYLLAEIKRKKESE